MIGAIIVPTRNKNKPVPGLAGMSAIERCARSVLGQSIARDLKIVFFDQGSTDGTREKIEALIDEYGGRAPQAQLIFCPENPSHHRGTNASINADFDFAIRYVEADVIMVTCGDDWAHPLRAERVMAAFAAHNPSWVGTKQQIERGGAIVGHSIFPDCYTRWVSAAEAIRHQIGSSGSMAWSRDLYERHGPMRGIESNDVILPVMALFERGLYYIDEPLHTYVEYADLGNLGMEGKLRAARDPAERAQLAEINVFHNAFNWSRVYARLAAAGFMGRLSADAQSALLEKLIGTAAGWANCREELILAGVEPINFKTKAPEA